MLRKDRMPPTADAVASSAGWGITPITTIRRAMADSATIDHPLISTTFAESGPAAPSMVFWNRYSM